jgi:hypothetical protein
MSITDQAIHALGIERDFYRERCEFAERTLVEVSRQLDEALQVVAAMAAERRAL